MFTLLSELHCTQPVAPAVAPVVAPMSLQKYPGSHLQLKLSTLVTPVAMMLVPVQVNSFPESNCTTPLVLA